MRIYVAARWGRREEAARLAEILTDEGHTVTSSWHVVGHSDSWPKRDKALMDVSELDAAEGLVLLAEPEGASNVGGNRYFECGYACARHLYVCVVGERELVFFHLPQVQVVADIRELISALEGY